MKYYLYNYKYYNGYGRGVTCFLKFFDLPVTEQELSKTFKKPMILGFQEIEQKEYEVIMSAVL